MADNDGPDENVALTEKEALKLLAYLTASADISLVEPRLYGPLRLIDAAGQIVDHVLKHGPSTERRAFWEEIKREIDTKKGWMTRDRAGFREFLQNMPPKVAEELKR